MINIGGCRISGPSGEDLALTIFTLSSHPDLVNTATSNAQDFTVTWLTTEAAVYHSVRVTLVPFKTIKRMSYARNTLRNGAAGLRAFCCDTDFKLEFMGCLKTFRRGHCSYSGNLFIAIQSSLASLKNVTTAFTEMVPYATIRRCFRAEYMFRFTFPK